MKRLIILAVMLTLPLSAGATNSVSKDGNFINVTFDGSTDFDMCDYLGVKNVTLYAISQDAVAANDTLTVRNGSASGVRIYGPFKDITGGGLIRYYKPRVAKPYVKGSEATAASKATFEVEYVK